MMRYYLATSVNDYDNVVCIKYFFKVFHASSTELNKLSFSNMRHSILLMSFERFTEIHGVSSNFFCVLDSSHNKNDMISNFIYRNNSEFILFELFESTNGSFYEKLFIGGFPNRDAEQNDSVLH